MDVSTGIRLSQPIYPDRIRFGPRHQEGASACLDTGYPPQWVLWQALGCATLETVELDRPPPPLPPSRLAAPDPPLPVGRPGGANLPLTRRSGPAWVVAVQPRRSRRTAHRQTIVLALIAILVLAGALHRDDPPPALRPASALVPQLPLAAVAGGVPVPMEDYTRQLRLATRGYRGPFAPPRSPTGGTIARILRDQAVGEAIAEALIDATARAHRLLPTAADISAQIARLAAAAGGGTALRRQMAAVGMGDADMRWVARHTLLRDRLAVLLHDPSWLDRLVSHSRITYYVGDGMAGPDGVPSIELGHPAPPFVAQDLDGRAVSLADHEGTPLILTFWATWCGWCGTELPMLARFAREHPNIAVVSLDLREDPGTIRAYIRAHGLRGLPVWRDPDGQAANSYTVTELPVTFFIDRHGIVRSYTFGPIATVGSLADQAGYAQRGVNNSY